MKNPTFWLALTVLGATAGLHLASSGGNAQPAPPSRQLTPRGQSPSTFPGNAVPGQFDSTGSQSIVPLPEYRRKSWATDQTTLWTNTDWLWWHGRSVEMSNIPPVWWTNVPPTYWTNVPASWWNTTPPGWWTNVPSQAWASVPTAWWTNATPDWTNRPPEDLRHDHTVNR